MFTVKVSCKVRKISKKKKSKINKLTEKKGKKNVENYDVSEWYVNCSKCFRHFSKVGDRWKRQRKKINNKKL